MSIFPGVLLIPGFAIVLSFMLTWPKDLYKYLLLVISPLVPMGFQIVWSAYWLLHKDAAGTRPSDCWQAQVLHATFCMTIVWIGIIVFYSLSSKRLSKENIAVPILLGLELGLTGAVYFAAQMATCNQWL